MFVFDMTSGVSIQTGSMYGRNVLHTLVSFASASHEGLGVLHVQARISTLYLCMALESTELRIRPLVLLCRMYTLHNNT